MRTPTRFTLSLVALVALACTPPEDPPDEPACVDDADCAVDGELRLCEGGACVTGCAEDRNCFAPNSCVGGRGGVCAEDNTDEGCVNDGECAANELCEGGECLAGCFEGRNCFPPRVCVGGAGVGGGVCTEDNTDEGCISDNQCGSGELCIGDACVPACELDRNCFAPNRCLQDACVSPCDPLLGTGCGFDTCNVTFPNGLDAPEGWCTAPVGFGAVPFEECTPASDRNFCGSIGFCLPLGPSSGICLRYCNADLTCDDATQACVEVAPGSSLRACTPRCAGGLGDCPAAFGLCAPDPATTVDACADADNVCLLGGCTSAGCPEQCEVADACAGQTCGPVTTTMTCGDTTSDVCQ